MSKQWEHAGPGGDLAGRFLDAVTGGLLGTTETVIDPNTGEYREVCVGPGQTVGEAIENGQWVAMTNK